MSQWRTLETLFGICSSHRLQQNGRTTQEEKMASKRRAQTETPETAFLRKRGGKGFQGYQGYFFERENGITEGMTKSDLPKITICPKSWMCLSLVAQVCLKANIKMLSAARSQHSFLFSQRKDKKLFCWCPWKSYKLWEGLAGLWLAKQLLERHRRTALMRAVGTPRAGDFCCPW